jgi:hypothetical protein
MTEQILRNTLKYGQLFVMPIFLGFSALISAKAPPAYAVEKSDGDISALPEQLFNLDFNQLRSCL